MPDFAISPKSLIPLSEKTQDFTVDGQVDICYNVFVSEMSNRRTTCNCSPTYNH